MPLKKYKKKIVCQTLRLKEIIAMGANIFLWGTEISGKKSNNHQQQKKSNIIMPFPNIFSVVL